MKLTSMRGNTVIWGASLALERAFALFVLPIFAKNMGQEAYGVWTQIIVTSSIAVVVLSLGFNTTFVRFTAGKDRRDVSAILHRVGLCVIVGISILLVGFFAFREQVALAIWGSSRYAYLVTVFGLFIATEALLELVTVSALRAKEMMMHCSIYYLLRYIARVAILATGIIYFQNLHGSLLFIVIAQAVLLGFVYCKDIVGNIGFHFRLEATEWQGIMRFSLPFFFYSFLVLLAVHSNRYLILHLLSVEQVSIYASYYSLAGVIGVLYSVLGFTLYPRMMSLWNGGNVAEVAKLFGRAVSFYVYFSAILVAGITMLNAPIISLLATREYIAGYPLMLFLGLAVFLFGLYQIHFYVMLLEQTALFNSVVMFISLLTLVSLSVLFIPLWGVEGGALALLIAHLFLACLTMRRAGKILRYRVSLLPMMRGVVVATLIAGGIFVYGSFFDLFAIHHLAVVVPASGVVYFGADLFNKGSLLRDMVGRG